MRSRFPPLLLLGIIFLASLSVSLSEKPNGRKCVKTCESEKDPSSVQTCKLRCKHVSESGEKEEGVEERELPEPHPSHEKRGRRERGHQEGEKKEEEKEEREQPRPFPPSHSREYKREEEQWKGRHRREDPEERERVRQREEEIRQREREEMREREREREEMREREREREEMKERERQREKEMREREKEEKPWRREKKKKWEEIEEEEGKGFPDSDTLTQNNPFHLSSNRFRTLFKNQLGHIRALRMFDQSSSTQLQNLQDYRVVEFKSKPNTLLLPHHANADFLLVVLSGRALINFVKPNDRDPYYLDPGYAQIIPAGTTFYLVNPDRKKNLRVIKLAIPVNRPAKFENFFLSSTQQQQSYLQGFSEDILEASFDSTFEEISKGLFGEKRPQQEGVIVELSNEKIGELRKSVESSSRKTNSFDYEPFNLRSSHPVYSNKFGVFYEITPKKNPLLRELNILLNSVDINKGGLLLPHYNSKAIVILVVNEGEAKVELVGPREEQQQKQRDKKEESMEVQRYRAELSEDDIFVIPAAYPVSINATSNLNFVAFGINAENNQRNFLAGEKDNVISEIPRQVLELSFPGSGADVEKLIENQRESYFVDGQAQQNEENGKNGRKGPLSSILGAIY